MINFRNTFFLFLTTLFIIANSGCSKDPDVEVVTLERVEVTIRDNQGALMPGVMVYLFKDAPTTSDGKTPAKSVGTATSDANGKAAFEREELLKVGIGNIAYITVLQKVAGEYQVTGSAEVTLAEGSEMIQKDLTVTPVETYDSKGFYPATISQQLVMDEYNRWKNTQVVACNDGLRVISENSSETKVEAIGFGMLLAAYADDKETFDGLHRFYNSKRTVQAANMMAWNVTCSGIIDPGSATDGDIDVAFSLIVADKQFEGNYLEDAKAILKTVRDNVIVSCTVNGEQVLVLGPGYSGTAWGGCQMMDIMYHTPAFFRIFAEVTGDDTWSQLADDTYVTLNKGAHPTTGLVPDWQTATGTPGPGGRVGYFGYDACRAPWKLTLDYLWNGNEESEAWAKKIATWAVSVGPKNIVDGYELNGTPRGANGLNSAFLGGFAVATMAHSQAAADQFGTEMSKLRDTYWFNINTRCLYLFTLSGNFWDPRTR